MFVLFHQTKQKYPIKVWLRKPEQVEAGCMEQALHLANLPFLHQWVALMPDTHQGIGMPIGGVIATKDVIIPNAVEEVLKDLKECRIVLGKLKRADVAEESRFAYKVIENELEVVKPVKKLRIIGVVKG